MDYIISFTGKYKFLSNFSYAPTPIGDRIYNTNEHYFQASKAKTWEDHDRINAVATPKLAKKLGGSVDLRPYWNHIRVEVMMSGLIRKFLYNPGYADNLMKLKGVYLIEGNTWHDNFWGDCTCVKCVNIEGVNMLGKLLMLVRDNLQNIKR